MTDVTDNQGQQAQAAAPHPPVTNADRKTTRNSVLDERRKSINLAFSLTPFTYRRHSWVWYVLLLCVDMGLEGEKSCQWIEFH